MKTIITVIVSVVLGVTPLPTAHKPPEQMDPTGPKITVTKYKQIETIKQKPPEDITPISETAKLPPVNPPTPVPSQPVDNESVTWNYLINQGFARHQVAGIMGNLQQEHGFQTSDVPGGLGIAQWTSGRRTNLMQRSNYLDITVQLQFLMEELNGSETTTLTDIRASGSIEQAVYAFSHGFERCGDCRDNQRIAYAYQILSRH